MAQTERNSRKRWSEKDIQSLHKMQRENTPTRVMGLKLGRTPGAIRNKASQIGLTLKPTNQSPYNRNTRK